MEHGSPILTLLQDPRASRLIKQGAEARVYISQLFPPPTLLNESEQLPGDISTSRNALIKYRFPKTYRHPSLSEHLTITRTVAEARALVRCMRAGVHTPRVLCVDETAGILALELLDGYSVRELLGAEDEDYEDSPSDSQKKEVLRLTDEEAITTMQLVGTQLAKMHLAHVIHGDLTTSNMMLCRSSQQNVKKIVSSD